MKSQPDNLPTYDSLGHCAAATGIPLGKLKRAKRQGCPAFHSGRVSLAPLLRHLFAQPADAEALDIPTLQAEQLSLQNQKLKAQGAIIRREWVAADDVERWGAELGVAARRIVEQIHLTAPDLAGSTVGEISNRLKEHEQQILAQFHSIGDKLAQHQSESRREIFLEGEKPAKPAKPAAKPAAKPKSPPWK